MLPMAIPDADISAVVIFAVLWLNDTSHISHSGMYHSGICRKEERTLYPHVDGLICAEPAAED